MSTSALPRRNISIWLPTYFFPSLQTCTKVPVCCLEKGFDIELYSEILGKEMADAVWGEGSEMLQHFLFLKQRLSPERNV